MPRLLRGWPPCLFLGNPGVFLVAEPACRCCAPKVLSARSEPFVVGVVGGDKSPYCGQSGVEESASGRTGEIEKNVQTIFRLFSRSPSHSLDPSSARRACSSAVFFFTSSLNVGPTCKPGLTAPTYSFSRRGPRRLALQQMRRDLDRRRNGRSASMSSLANTLGLCHYARVSVAARRPRLPRRRVRVGSL